MIGHYDEFMEKICSTTIVVKGVDEEFRPGLALKKRASAPSGRGNHVCVARVGRVFSSWSQDGTSAAKAANLLWHVAARLEGALFQSLSVSAD